MHATLEPKAFRDRAAFRAWLETHHESATELIVRCFKAHASHRGLTYRQALDEALCIGWIDGVRRALDGDSFTQRFSPRKAKSSWSAVNVARVKQLEAEGRMRPAGVASFGARVASRYSYESRPQALSPALLKPFRANRAAWRFFEIQPPWYRRTASFWVMSAKRPETRAKRLGILIACSAQRECIPALKRPNGSDRR